MGFFFEQKVAEQAPVQRKAPGGVKAVRKQIALGARGCDACSLKQRWGVITSPRMPIAGPADADLLLLGDAPNTDADMRGQPLEGARNKALLDLIPGHGRQRAAHQNVVRCAPSAGSVISYQDMHACSIHLDAETSAIKYVIGIGSPPLARYWPGSSITRVHGAHFPIMLGDHPVWYYPILDPHYVEQMGGMKTAAGAVLRADIARFFRDSKSWGKPQVASLDPKAVIIPQSYAEASTLVDTMLKQPLGIDIETGDRVGAALKPYQVDARILSAAISDGDLTIAFPIDHPEASTNWGLKLVLDVARRQQWVAHNAGFEWMWLTFFGGRKQPLHPFDDSQAITRIYFDRETIASLEDVSVAILGVDIKALTGVNPRMILEYPLSEMLPYNGLDAQASALIWRYRYQQAKGDNYARLIHAIETTADMELQGLPIDLVESAAQKVEWTDKISAIEQRVRKIYEVRQFELARQQPFRLSANEDIGEALAVHGKLALPSKRGRGDKVTYETGEDVLVKLTKESKHPLVEAVLEYREATGNLSRYIDAIQEVPARYPDGLLHPSYTVLLTRTGRLSSIDPNIQNFPKRRHKSIRRQVVAPPGHLMVAVDYGQLEARVIAMASMDRVLCDAIITGYDIHSVWRDKILARYPPYYDRMAEMGNTDPADKKATMKGGRSIIKTDYVFAQFFGGTTASSATRTGVPLGIMQDISDEFWDTFRGVKAWIKKQRREYEETAAIRTLTGRTRRGIEWGNECINTPVQGTAADIVIDGMNSLRQLSLELKEPALMPRINIHDDLTFFIPDDNTMLDSCLAAIQTTMTELRYSWQVVPFMVEISVGYNWAELEEVGTFTGAYRR